MGTYATSDTGTCITNSVTIITISQWKINSIDPYVYVSTVLSERNNTTREALCLFTQLSHHALTGQQSVSLF